MIFFCISVLLLGAAVDVIAFPVTGFQCSQPISSRHIQPFLASQSSEADSKEEEQPKLDAFLKKKYPDFYNLVNDDMVKAIKQGPVTVFVPNAAAFENLGQKKMSQIDDPRNLEIRERMGSYHMIPEESINAMKLRTEDWSKGKPKDGSPPNTMIAGINTLSGEVPVGRSKSGGFFGFGAKEDGDIVIGPEAKIVQSYDVDGSFVHEMSDLISPTLLWRYCDQLRIL